LLGSITVANERLLASHTRRELLLAPIDFIEDCLHRLFLFTLEFIGGICYDLLIFMLGVEMEHLRAAEASGCGLPRQDSSLTFGAFVRRAHSLLLLSVLRQTSQVEKVAAFFFGRASDQIILRFLAVLLCIYNLAYFDTDATLLLAEHAVLANDEFCFDLEHVFRGESALRFICGVLSLSLLRLRW